jgi:hypothetical protein
MEMPQISKSIYCFSALSLHMRLCFGRKIHLLPFWIMPIFAYIKNISIEVMTCDRVRDTHNAIFCWFLNELWAAIYGRISQSKKSCFASNSDIVVEYVCYIINNQVSVALSYDLRWSCDGATYGKYYFFLSIVCDINRVVLN